jgi:hypothetical protein
MTHRGIIQFFKYTETNGRSISAAAIFTLPFQKAQLNPQHLLKLSPE